MDYILPTISFGTSCMGRIAHLKKTYIKNIELALSSGIDCQFVLLNYNSRDGLDEWVREDLRDYIKRGVVKYLINTTATKFSQSKTKNTTLKNSRGDILCTLDADNIMNIKFLDILKKHFIYSSEITKTNPILQCRGGPMAGRLAFKREDFLKLRGFDEAMENWGYEDRDFICRLERLLKTESTELPKCDCGRALGHPAEPNRMESLYLNRQKSLYNLKKNKLIVNPENWGNHFDHEK